MILSNKAIEKAVNSSDLGIAPFDRDNLKQASYTFALSKKILKPESSPALSIRSKPDYQEVIMDSSGFILEPGMFVLGYTEEKLSLKGKYACLLSTRSSCAQLGLNILLGSDFAEPDTDSQQILEIHNVAASPIKLEPGMKIVKGVFFEVN